MDNKTKLIKVAKGAGIAGGAAVLTYILPELTEFDFGPYTAAVVAFLSVGINALLKVLESFKETEAEVIEEI